VGVTLRAIAQDSDFLSLYKTQVRVFVVIDLHNPLLNLGISNPDIPRRLKTGAPRLITD
jgi:hypothetical protein